jgi:hypothetical protein
MFFRFTSRGLLCLTVVIVLTISWVHKRYALERMRTLPQEATAEPDNLGGQIAALNALSK